MQAEDSSGDMVRGIEIETPKIEVKKDPKKRIEVILNQILDQCLSQSEVNRFTRNWLLNSDYLDNLEEKALELAGECNFDIDKIKSAFWTTRDALKEIEREHPF
jgi:hypothetical protein